MFDSRKCTECGSTEIVEDRQQGHAVCRDCGSVVESTFIVSELQFEETSGGGVRALGSLVGPGGINQVGGISGVATRDERRRWRLLRASDEIHRISSSINFTEDAMTHATNFYSMALDRGLTRGIRWTKSLSACVYIVARIRNMPVMLLDLSDIVQINVWDLGQVYNKFVRELQITIPVQDPSALIMRFAQRLDLGESAHRVMNTAVRICQRMNRDWMHYGRRPAGLCGAALLAACRYHAFNRTFEEFAKMVCMSTSTLRLRLKEFADTKAGRMRMSEFLETDDSDIPDELLPPICKAQRRSEVESVDERLLEETRQFQERMEELIETRQMEVAMRFASAVKDDEVRRRFELTEEEMDILTEQISSSVVGADGTEESPADEATDGGSPVAEARRIEDYVVPANRVDDSFSDVDDEEIDRYLLKPEEIVRKTKKWVQENLQFLKKAREKEQKKKEEGEAQKDKPSRKRPAAQRKRRDPRKQLHDIIETKMSGKINYEILEKLTNDFDSTAGPITSKRIKTPSSVKDEESKRELKQGLREIHSLVNDIKQDMKVKHDPEQQDEEDFDDIELSDDDDHQQSMLSASQMMAQEMGVDYGADEEY
ncbi:transcription factor IIIB 90 kDa subunit-like [Tropilaelaps mercedesae]|uniref:B-related factor 1 n=1 Tax=Tropilaelaps mercedesae TaxID=418985 RepID=A0A1V9XH72_9ACAR|nr:transcription factor IIIB 90 kDa subunit-like [Tropilaelaps mercedesae]